MSAITLNAEEKEILSLKANLWAINEMVNYALMTINHNDPNSSVMFKTASDRRYFNIILLDFLSAKIFGVGHTCLAALDVIINDAKFGVETSSLSDPYNKFKDWLGADIELEYDGEKQRTFWFPSIDKDIALKIKREEFIRICGNISKHNPLGLDRQAQIIAGIFKRNDVEISLSQALLIMDEFYEQFHDDLLTYHSSTIAEFLNNLRWGIYDYLKPLYNQSVEFYWDDYHKMRAYRYHYPQVLVDEYAKQVFWDLMNDVRSEPYVPKFQVAHYFKGRY